VVGDMIFVHELRGILGSQYFGFIMTLETLSFRDMAVSSYHIDMTLFTIHASCNIFPMIEAPTFDFNVPFGFDMAGGTPSNSTGYTLLLPPWSSSIKMAGKTSGLVNSEVSSLDKLSMARGATKPYSSSQLTQMLSMRKADILKYHIPFQVVCFVTPIL
jgi:hypothetical protein